MIITKIILFVLALAAAEFWEDFSYFLKEGL